MKLPRDFYTREDTVQIARELLGKLLVVPDEEGRRISGMIVETEAYLGITDRAAHTYGGRRTARNEATYLLGGHAYVFFIYGMYFQLNVVTGSIDTPHVVLIRGLEPVEGIDVMRQRRGAMKDVNLSSGPGKLCIAMDIDRRLNGADLLGNSIWLEDHRSVDENHIAVGTRIGIDYAGEDAQKPWRFWIKGSPFISRKERTPAPMQVR
jgi:DNA-3-methyladenine glycosylase